MNAYELFAAMDGIGDEILERSEIKRKSPRRYIRPSLIAACCALVLSVLYAQLRFGHLHPTPQVDPTQETTEIPRQVVNTPYYNKEHNVLVAQELLYYTRHKLSEEEMAKVLPEKLAPWMQFSADAMAYHEDDREGIVRMEFTTPTTLENVSLDVVLGRYQPSYGYGNDAVVYRCGQVDYILTLGDYTKTTHSWHFGAFAEIQGVPVYMEMRVPTDLLEAAKAVFEEALVCFSSYEENGLNIQIWSLEAFPDYYYPSGWYIEFSRHHIERYTHYGIFLPEEDSKVFTSEEITWDGGEISRIAVSCYKGKKLALEWNIYEGEQLMQYGGMLFSDSGILYSDLDKCIAIQDLTLDTVQQYVKDSHEYLCVQYDEVIVSVRPHNVNARWLYDQLQAVGQRMDKAPKQAIQRFQSMLSDPASQKLCLKIYYMDPEILTRAPMSGEDLKSESLISVDTQTLLGHTELLQRLDESVLKREKVLRCSNARLYYVFETGDGEPVLEIVMDYPTGGIYVNGMAVEYDPVFLEVLAPFATEDLRELWLLDQLSTGSVE